MMALQGLSVSARLMWGFAIPRMPRKYQANPLWNHYQCKDGRWICLGMLQPDRYWADFCRAVGRPELATDERFVDLRVRAANAGAAIEILDAVFADQAARRVAAASCAPAATSSSARSTRSTTCPTIRRCSANDYIVDFDHPRFGQHAGDRHAGAPRARRPAASAGRRPSSASTPRRSSPSCSATRGSRSRP